MMTDWLLFFEKAIWLGFAAIGFGVLFNVPVRTLTNIWLMAAVGGLIKFLLIRYEVNVVLATFAGASVIGFLSVRAAHGKHAPPMIFAIPAVIPMVPGAFAYRMMIGFIKLAGDKIGVDYQMVINDTLNNGLKALFIFLALAAGVALPMLITRKESVKEILLLKPKS